MSTSLSSSSDRNKRLSDCGKDKRSIFNKIASVLPDKPIFTKVKKETVEGKGYGFNQKENLLTASEALDWINQGGNIGIALGVWIDGQISVNFDIENEEAIDDKTRSLIDNHAVAREKTKHGNTNRIVRITDGRAYDLLRSYGESHNHLTEGESDDLEIITKGHAVLPPSEYNHKHCSEEKRNNEGCDQQDRTTRYLLDWVQDCEPLSYDTIEEIGELLDLESDDTDDSDVPYDETDDLENVPSPEPTKNVLREYKENVPSVKHEFDERKGYMRFGDWKGQEQFIQLYRGDFSSISGSQKQHKAECKIANTIGFYFGRNEQIIRFFMDSLDFETIYERNERHRKQLLEWATNVEWCYCKGVSFKSKHLVASEIYYREPDTINEIEASTLDIERDTIQRAMDIIETEGKIETTKGEHGEKIIQENNLTEGYLDDLEDLIEKYGYNSGESSDIDTTTNVTRVRI